MIEDDGIKYTPKDYANKLGKLFLILAFNYFKLIWHIKKGINSNIFYLTVNFNEENIVENK